ncbi:MAG: hypothetical protein GY715_09080 [Planctomycetes bacterium]|nr:hypothetical protein [Planctomycetota bacterium]
MPATGLGLGMLIMPVSILLLMRKDQGPVGMFLRAGAISEETARRPAALGIGRLFLVQDAAKRGVLVALADGRYYVNVPTHRRRRRRSLTLALLVAVTFVALGSWLLIPR